MGKSKVLIAMGLCTMLLATGCSKKDTAANTYKKYVELGEYKGIEVVLQSSDVTEDEVTTKINTTLEQKSTMEDVKNRGIKKDDTANIDYVGKIDGKEFEGGSAKGTDLVIGSGQFIPGFEDQLIGAKKGDVVDVKVTFPEDYSNKDVAGKDAVFTVTVNSIKKKVVPELTDKWVKDNSDSKTVKEYKESVRKSIEDQKKEDAQNKKTADVLTGILENSKIKGYPKDEINEYVESTINYYKAQASQFGMDYDSLLSQVLKKTDAEFREEAKENAKETISREMICFMIADKEGITVSKDEYNEGVEKYAKQYGYDNTDDFVKQYGKDLIEQNILLEKVLAFVTDNAKEVKSIDKSTK